MSLIIIPPKLINFSSLVFFLITIISNGLDDHKTLIFHHCSPQKLKDPFGEYINARTRLFKKLQFESFKYKFSRTFVMVGDSFEGSMTGLFQCRQDLDDHKCMDCMKAFRNVSKGLCGDSMAARIQLSGCHVQYEADTYNDIFTLDNEIKHKCGENQATTSSEYFEQIRSQAFEALEREVGEGEGNNGFYSINHEGIHVISQCEVGVDECKCSKCVLDALEIIEEECVNSIYGQVILDLCYVNYEFNPHEIRGGGGGFNAGSRFGKVAAIAIGGVVLLFVALLLLRCLKKKDDWADQRCNLRLYVLLVENEKRKIYSLRHYFCTEVNPYVRCKCF